MDTARFGTLDPFVQRYDCHVETVDDFLQLTQGQPLSHWTNTPQDVKAEDITTWFPNDPHLMAIYSAQGQSKNDHADDSLSNNRHSSTVPQPLSYADLHGQCHACPPYRHDASATATTTTTTVVAVLLPLCLRAETAVVLVALLAQDSHVCVAPLDANMPRAKLYEALAQLNVTAMVTTDPIWKDLSSGASANDNNDFDLALLTDVRTVRPRGDKAGAVQWNMVRQPQLPQPRGRLTAGRATNPNFKQQEDDNDNIEEPPRMLLRTSGTTSGPKVVALGATHLLYSGLGLAYGLQLTPDDVNCNAMPLFHVGGIAGALLCVLVSGSSTVMLQGSYCPQTFLDCLVPTGNPHYQFNHAAPTWYYAAPTMHQALLLAAKSRQWPQLAVRHNLRLIRSAAAHLPHETALELAQVFRGAAVYPTYGMTEAMPICIPQQGIRAANDVTPSNVVVDTVGPPAACSVKIVESSGEALAYGEIGEIAVYGPGALRSYVGLSPTKTHTPDGWLLTGDVGYLDEAAGRLFIKGRSKEMIKRGGEQVWPNEVDRVVLAVPGVEAAVTFGVPNELWGEEVAVAVVLARDTANSYNSRDYMKHVILEACRKDLDHFAVPKQIIFVDSTNDLAKGATGKYLRYKMADHLGVASVDTGALQALKAASALNSTVSSPDSSIRDDASDISDEKDKGAETVKPSSALNGVRFITACFVFQLHIGFFDNMAWTKIQSFSMNMPIFFTLAAFQLACNVRTQVLTSWSSFVGSKIGSMHALFVVAELIGLPSYAIAMCGPSGYNQVFKDGSCVETGYLRKKVLLHIGQFTTGLFGIEDGNLSSVWFQSVIYMFLVLFPWLDYNFRDLPTPTLLKWLAATTVLSVTLPPAAFTLVSENLHYTIVTWMPNLLAAMIAGYLFKRFPSTHRNADENRVPIYQNRRVFGIVTDLMSVFFLMILVAVANSPNELGVEIETYQEMRPEDDVERMVKWETYEETVVWAEDVTWEEYVEYIHADEESWSTVGRWEVQITDVFWRYRLGSPLVLIWLYAMAHGQGLTARIMNSRVLQFLAPLGYPTYLLHIPMARMYWLATRGFMAQEWWDKPGDYPFPVAPQECLTILGLTLLLGYVIDRQVLPHVIPHTVKLGVFVCEKIAEIVGQKPARKKVELSVFDQVRNLVKSLSGVEATESTKLVDLGLDSLGATAFLGTLRAKLPLARNMSLAELSSFDSIGDLVVHLQNIGSTNEKKHGICHVRHEGNAPLFSLHRFRRNLTNSTSTDVSYSSLPSFEDVALV